MRIGPLYTRVPSTDPDGPNAGATRHAEIYPELMTTDWDLLRYTTLRYAHGSNGVIVTVAGAP